MDKILKIYDGVESTSSLVYTIRGDLSNYLYVDEESYNIDKLEALIHNPNGKYDIRYGYGWALLSEAGDVHGVGRLTQGASDTAGEVIVKGGYTQLVGEGLLGVFKDRKIDRTQTVGDSGEDVLEDIIDNDMSPYTIVKTSIDTPANTFNDLKFDGVYAHDVIRWCCENSYGATPKNFYARVTASPGSTFGGWTFHFHERETAAALKTLYPRDIQPVNFNLRRRNDLNANVIYVYGATKNINKCPIDGDWWTEQASDAAYNDFWSENGGDAETEITRITSTTQHKVGTSGVGLTSDVNDATTFTLNLDDTHAYSSTYTPSDMFSSGNGFIIDDDKDQRLRFWMQADEGLDEEWGIYLSFDNDSSNSYYAKGGQQKWSEDMSGIYLDYIVDTWQLFEFKIQDTFTEQETTYLEAINFVCDQGTPASNLRIFVDGLYFYEATGRVEGSYDGSGANTDVHQIINNQNITSDWLAEDVATAYFNSQRNQFVGSLYLNRPDATLYSGGTIGVKHPSYGVNVAKIPVKRMVLMPYTHMIELGDNKTPEEISNNLYQDLRVKT